MDNLDINKICEDLQASDRRVKTTALQKLREECVNSGAALSADALAAHFDGLYLHLLKCYADRFESVRDEAVRVVSAFLDRLPPTDFHLLNVVATLNDRMGQTETVEGSEEIRLLYIEQLHVLVRQYALMGNVHAFRECYVQVVGVLVKSIRDSYPAVQREACGTLVDLARVADAFELQEFTEPLALALYGMLNHKHAKARISAVEALGRVALHMNASGDGLRRLIMEVSPLLMDSMPLVRRECGQMGVLMLLELMDRYSYFERILPLVLCCLKDDSPDVVAYIRPLWEKCGKLYYDENEAELSQVAAADLPVDNYPAGVQRPTLGCRGLVQRSIRLLKLITRESGDWKDNVRIHSLKLFYQFVLHAEAAMTAKFFEVYPDVAHACVDAEALVRAEAKKVADLMGRLLFYDDWIENGLDGLVRNARESYLTCFFYMFSASLGGNFEQLLRLSKLLRSSDYSHTLKPRFQLYIIKMLETLLDKSAQVTATLEQLLELYEYIYVAGMKVMALSYSLTGSHNEDVNRGQLLIERVVKLENSTVALLHERLFALVLDDIENLDAALEDNAEPVLLLDGLINLCHIRAAYLPALIAKVQIVFANCCDSAQVRIFSSLSIAALLWSDTVSCEREQSTQLLSNFVNEIIEPYLSWQAGASAEAMRSLAMATLCALSQGAGEEMREVLPSLAKLMPSLLEDRNVTTRHYAVKTMCYFQNMGVEDLKPLAYATLQRLDDPSSGIRLMAATAVGKLKPVFKADTNAEKEVKFELEVWEAFIKRAMDLLLLHYESPEKEVRAVAERTLKQLAKAHPDCWEERYQRALAMVQQKDQLGDLYAKLSIQTCEKED
ncbi:dynein assembly factor 5, axonemal [Scaptodrosophila lebanonensis]|uniref:Dynein assembly factor 5, axonemal n=1 Tax=Drosophila lebanonensis TaxID=7225 RepID=A0A6J2T8R3_DROLE|nr:dynein assembly factor 5, axonemal [Scaptodrosophila lebanonensis]XP_030371533.1 dynein assembly factor 5, axonemal [Scaptodrosophila lebanonensis]